MDSAGAIGLSRQVVLGRALEITANNIANQSTAGYKGERASFQEYLVSANSINSNTPNPDLSYVIDTDSVTDFSQGSLQQTHASLDFAINGDGFFAIETQNGQAYTRDGHFGVSPFGELVTRDGNLVLDDTGSSILLDPQGGAVLLSPEGDLQQNGAPIGRLGVYRFENPSSLQKQGNNLFQSSQTPVIADQNGAANIIQQGFIEASNIAPIQGITQMIEISRAYTQATELIETTDELSREAIRTLTRTI